MNPILLAAFIGAAVEPDTFQSLAFVTYTNIIHIDDKGWSLEGTATNWVNPAFAHVRYTNTVWETWKAPVAESQPIPLLGRVTTVISTNVVAGDNGRGCAICKNSPGHALTVPLVYGFSGPCAPYVAPTEKWTVTNVVKTVTLAVDWDGELLTYSKSLILSSTTNRWKLNTTWTPAN